MRPIVSRARRRDEDVRDPAVVRHAALADELVDRRQRLHVLDQRVGQQRVDHVRGAGEDVRALRAGDLVGGGRDRVQADDDHPLGAEDSAGLIGAFRRVPPSKYQPAAGPSVPRPPERGRDRRRGAHVLLVEDGRDVVDAALVVAHLVRRPPWWKTTLRPVSADVATTAAEISRPSSTWRRDLLERDQRSSVCLSGVASSSEGTSSESSPVKVSGRAGDPVEVAERGRRQHVAPVISSHSRAAGASGPVVLVGACREVGAVDGADARADDDVRALVAAAARAAARRAPRPRRRRAPAAGEHERDRLASSPARSRTVSRKARAVVEVARAARPGSGRPRTRGGGRPGRARSRRSRPRAPRACRRGRRAGTASGRASSSPACRARG